jgi:hypothetical protein
MSSVIVAGDTSGSVTLQAPAVSGSTVLTLPTTSGTLVVNSGAQTIEFADGSASAPSITNSGDTNTGIFFPAADTIAFTKGGTEAMRIDSAGNVGIGTASPSGRLDVGAVAGSVTSGDLIVTTGSTTASVTVGRLSSAGSDNTTFNVRNRIGTSLFYVDTAGVKTATTISVGAATPSASGAGITFPATQSASTDANTLDDYEEGTWTPVIGGESGATGQTYTVQKGIYTKIGRNVTISGYITLTNKGTFSGSTYTCIIGLPFTGSAYDYAVNINYYLNLGGNIVQCTGYVASNGSTIYLCANTAASANLQATGFPQSYITNSTTIEFTATYQV